MKEIWVVIKGFDNYSISNFGNLKNNKTNRLRVQSKDSSGYACCTLSLKGKTYTKSIHRLVAEAFIPNPDLFKEVNHRNGNKLDNRVENIEWCSRSHNLKHSYRVLNRVPPMLGRLAEKNPRSIPVLQFTKEGDFIKEHTNLRNAGRSVNTSGDNISRACKLKHKFSYSKGFIWKFKKDYINEQENHVLHSNVSE